ncbi:hypothetical protein TWF703_007069 [Orbilia oligospora]|uniref:Rhamnogalacturonase A/B/Epimerase-like pectate lyase domain-containing protein n=1 Tax=Orbilia oligospora TaxID=2813651 RepID=A0A7C8JQY8_ORBOL|nr:hypothetical protein TWF703_007069 [Orbilia oligospora]
MNSGWKFKLVSLVTTLVYQIDPASAGINYRHLQERGVVPTTTKSCPIRCIDFPNTVCGGTWQTCIPSCTGDSIPTFTPPPCMTTTSTTSCPLLCVDNFSTNSCGIAGGTCFPHCPGQPITIPPLPPCPSTTTTAPRTTTSKCPTVCLDFMTNSCGGLWGTCVQHCPGKPFPSPTPPPCTSTRRSLSPPNTNCNLICVDNFTPDSCGNAGGTCFPHCPGQPITEPPLPSCTSTPATTSSCPTLCLDFMTNSCGGLWGTCLQHCPGQPFPNPTPPPCTTSSRATITTTSKKTASTTTSKPNCSAIARGETPYYLDQFKHQGLWHLNSSYPVYRNVKCWGAKGNGVTDDTEAIIRALTEGKTCKGSNCQNSYIPPSLVYFPKGDYIIGKTLPIYRNTQILGNPRQKPTIRANGKNFAGSAMFETKVKENIGSGAGDFITLKSIILIGEAVPPERDFAGIRWNAGYASGLYQVETVMGSGKATKHRGIVVSNTPHIWMSDVSANRGEIGIDLSVQSGTLRNVAVLDSRSIGIRITSSYSLTLKNLFLYNTPIGIDASKTNPGPPVSQAVNSLVVVEGEIISAKAFIRTARGGSSTYPNGAGSIVIERFTVAAGIPVVQRDNGVNIYHPSPVNTYRYITLWAQGRRYTPPTYEVATMQNPITNPKSSQPRLRVGQEKGVYYDKHQPSPAYESFKPNNFISLRSQGIKGDGISDDTAKIQRAFNLAASTNRPIFVDYGIYIVTRTLLIHPGTRIVGEVWPKFLAAGSYFSNVKNPHPVLQIGKPGQTGRVEIQDILVTAKAGSAGAISFQWNLKGPDLSNDVGGMWSCHSVIGAQPFSGLEAAQCSHGARPLSKCTGGFMHLHITRHASNIYLENNYYAAAAYQSIQPSPSGPLDVYVGRGVLIDGSPGGIWLYSIASQNSVLYQYQIQNSADIFASSLESTNPSFQPNPMAPTPFGVINTTLSDPNFATICKAHTGAAYAKCAKAFGLRIINSDNVVIYSTSLLSGQNNFAPNCPGGHFNCQLVMVSVEKQARSPVNKLVSIYGFTVRGARYALLMDGKIIIDSQKNAGTSLALPVVAWFLVGGVLPS